MLISDKTYLGTKKNITREMEGNFIMIKGTIHQEHIIKIKVYLPNNGASKYMRTKVTGLHGKTAKSTIIVKYFNITFSIIERKSKNLVKTLKF